jgi:hypothetical protein
MASVVHLEIDAGLESPGGKPTSQGNVGNSRFLRGRCGTVSLIAHEAYCIKVSRDKRSKPAFSRQLVPVPYAAVATAAKSAASVVSMFAIGLRPSASTAPMISAAVFWTTGRDSSRSLAFTP